MVQHEFSLNLLGCGQMRTFILTLTHLFCWWIHTVDSSWLEESNSHRNTTTLSYLSVTPETSMPGVRSQTFCRSSAEPQPLSERAQWAQAYSSLTLTHGDPPASSRAPAPSCSRGSWSQTISLPGCGDLKGHEGLVGIRGMFYPDTTMSLPVHNSNNGGKQNNIFTLWTSQLTMFLNNSI